VGSGEILGEARLWGRCRGFRKLHGSKAKQMWWLSRAGTRRRVVATAVGYSAPSRGKAAAVARVLGSADGRMGSRGSAGCG
jgi:hypothetical protein